MGVLPYEDLSFSKAITLPLLPKLLREVCQCFSSGPYSTPFKKELIIPEYFESAKLKIKFLG